MNDFLQELVLTVLALFPAVFLCFYIYKKDKTEKEPCLLLMLLFALGIATIAPAILFEKALGYLNDQFFIMLLKNGVFDENFEIFPPVYQFIKAFFVVALVEEGLKWIALRLGTRKDRHFDSFFDGIIYSVFVSLGFAAWENIQYVAMYGFKTGLMRAVLSVPAHMFFAVFMGYFFSLYTIRRKAKKADEILKQSYGNQNAKSKISAVSYGLLSIIVPVIIHGFYDFCLFYSTIVTNVLFVTLMSFLYIYCFIKIHKTSKADFSHSSLIIKMLSAEYPDLTFTEK